MELGASVTVGPQSKKAQFEIKYRRKQEDKNRKLESFSAEVTLPRTWGDDGGGVRQSKYYNDIKFMK